MSDLWVETVRAVEDDPPISLAIRELEPKISGCHQQERGLGSTEGLLSIRSRLIHVGSQ